MQVGIDGHRREANLLLDESQRIISETLRRYQDETTALVRLLKQYDPSTVMARGYALVRGDVDVGATITIERSKDIIQAEVTHVEGK